jgi:hypothetical protein
MLNILYLYRYINNLSTEEFLKYLESYNLEGIDDEILKKCSKAKKKKYLYVFIKTLNDNDSKYNKDLNPYCISSSFSFKRTLFSAVIGLPLGAIFSKNITFDFKNKRPIFSFLFNKKQCFIIGATIIVIMGYCFIYLKRKEPYIILKENQIRKSFNFS